MGDVLWGINIAVQGAIIGSLGEMALASVSISTVVFSMIGVAVYGTAGASAVIIGQTVGSGDYDRVKQYTKKLQILFIIIGVISGLVLFVAKDYIFVWLVVIPFALLDAFVFHASPLIVFICLKSSDQILKCGVAVVKVNRFRWIRNLTRESVSVIKA